MVLYRGLEVGTYCNIYDGYNKKYKPFKTVVTINYPISGNIGGNNEKNT